MKPQHQLYTTANLRDDLTPADDAPVGDCWRTCVASVLDMDADKVPHFVDIELRNLDPNGAIVDGFDSISTTAHWLRERGRTLKGYTWKDYSPLWPVAEEHLHIWTKQFPAPEQQPYAIVCGGSPRGKWQHSVVVDLRTMQVASDPHPSNDGLTSITEIWLIR